MGTVKPIFGETLHDAKDLFSFFFFNVFLESTFNKFDLLLPHDLDLLFPHSTAKKVGFSEGETGHDLGSLHDLLLVHHNAKCGLKYLLQHGMRINNFFLSMLALDIDLDELHRPGAVQGIHGDEILDIGWLQLLQVCTHFL